MNFSKHELKFSVRELQRKALDRPVIDAADLFRPDTIMDHSIIRPSILNEKKIVVATFIWHTPIIKNKFDSALLFSLAYAASIQPRYKIKFTDIKDVLPEELLIWMPMVFGGNYKPECFKTNPFNNTPKNFGATFYTAYLDSQLNILNI